MYLPLLQYICFYSRNLPILLQFCVLGDLTPSGAAALQRFLEHWLRRHWSGDKSGFCQIPGCSDTPGTLLHIATAQCPSLARARIKAVSTWHGFFVINPILLSFINNINRNEDFLSFLVEPTTFQNVIDQTQKHRDIDGMGKLCYLTRTWLYSMHKERLILLDLWDKKWKLF